jgi:C4-dicarboxylate transporter
MFWQTTGRHARRKLRWWHRWFRTVAVADDGMTTAEYAIGTVAAAAFAAVLYTIVTGDSVVSGLTSLVEHALTVTF